MQRVMAIIKWISLLIGPIATIGFTSIHFLIQTGNIQVSQEIKTFREFITKRKFKTKTEVITPVSEKIAQVVNKE